MTDPSLRTMHVTSRLRIFGAIFRKMTAPKRRRAYLPLACVLLALATAGCVIAPDQGHNPGGIVLVAPPAPREEVIGEAPQPGYVWLSGYWAWVGDRHEWVGGHWAQARPGRHWVGHQWVRQGDGWRMKPGRWVRD